MSKFFIDFDLNSFWEDGDYSRKNYVDVFPSDELIKEVESELGYKLPIAYLDFMKSQNGGIPNNNSFPCKEETSWAPDHVAISGFLNIGNRKSNSLCGQFGSQFMVKEWGYPDIGIYFAKCPSAGHDMIALDYRKCGRDGIPQVVHVDQDCDYKITFLAENFETFVMGLVNWRNFYIE
ncbi:SMI1/KNR4 family protein [Vibrio hippocampi]|uniref:Knr4/Smi1-like domain-containing protein n=1 Tax=Vibrio hippocampi TaxID=654686 RepID=A0ABM8ZI07_9VIBR|nr:SMI1/KNR4 family protein [Vibrio hippocampi]CAH0525784.1 hypothetical protein VHP8226_01315 [Vibrio hippocampi]